MVSSNYSYIIIVIIIIIIRRNKIASVGYVVMEMKQSII